MIIERIRATFRDPFYRNEKRQAGLWRALLWLLPPILIGPIIIVPCLNVLFFPLMLSLPAWMAAEGLLYELDRDTLDGLLLTPAERERILWAKLLARLRPVLWFCASLPFIGAAVGAFIAIQRASFPNEGDFFTGVAIGGGIGLVVAVLGLGQGLTSGAFGIVAVLICRSRVKAYLLSALMTFALYMVENMVAGIIILMMLLGPMIFSSLRSYYGSAGFDTPETLIGIAFICAGVVFLAAHLFLVNMLLPARLMRYAAREMDHKLLQGA